MTPCRECQREVSEQATSCPQCGAPYPAKEKWDGRGFEYKSPIVIAGLPLLHISFKYRPGGMPVVARGIIAIGQFACGMICVSQFGVGVICVSQFALGVLAFAQFGIAHSLIAQIGIYVADGIGQQLYSLPKLLKG